MLAKPCHHSRQALVALLVGCGLASWVPASLAQTYYPEQEIHIDGLVPQTAKSKAASDVLATSVEIMVHDNGICCGKNSALGDSVEAADPKSLKDVASKLQGRHMLSDGRAITVTAEYLPADSVHSGELFTALAEKRAPLMMWNRHVYVVYGLTFKRTVNQDGGVMDAIHKFLLLDPRFSNEHQIVTFDRLTDDWGKVQGLLTLRVSRQ